MASTSMRKLMEYLAFADPAEERDDYAVEAEPEPHTRATERRETHAEVTPLTRATAVRHEEIDMADELRRIVTVHPSSYNDARTIGEAFREGTPVIMNLTGMSEPDAKRMVDFAAGLTFGMHGVLEKVTSRVFLLSPASVEVETEGAGSENETGRLFNQA